jgi:cell division protein FtsI (penicillin-binding protein 3)
MTVDFKDTRVAGKDPSRWMRLRVLILGGTFLALLGTVFARAVFLQVVQRDRLRGMAQDQYVRAVEIPARRGDIFDRRGVALAQSVDVDSIWIDPSLLPDVREASQKLAKKLRLDAGELYERLSKAKRFAWVKRQVRPEEVSAVQSLELPAIGFTKEPKRFYPQRELASQVMGVVGTDGQGLEGLELAFDDELTGQKERLDGLRDARGRKLLVEGDANTLERQGASISLTLDRQIQYVTEKALAKAVEDAKALDGVAVVMDPRTGEILAIANAPRFNPNAAEQVSAQRLRDRAALDAFEPGSTMKSFVISAALEEHAIRTDQTFFCENGAWAIGRRVIHDTHKHQDLTPGEILRVSSNIGAAKIAGVLGRDRLVRYYEKFGFGDRTGLALPGEAKGQLPYPKADIQLATQAFGQGMSATAVQIAAAYSAIANGGTLMRPYLVSKVVDPDGVVLLENGPTEVRRVLSAPTARTLISMLEGVVSQKEGSTAPRARMDAYQVAGKTGTAQKVDPLTHAYSEKRIVSFAGMVPAEDPRLVILVVVDEPTVAVNGGHDGGSIAAPAFKEIASFALPYLGVPPSHPVSPAVAVAEKPHKPEPVAEEPIVDAITEQPGEGEVVVPNVGGKVGREAVAKLLSVALEPRLLGSGRVVSQTPPAGARVEKGAQIVLELAAQP